MSINTEGVFFQGCAKKGGGGLTLGVFYHGGGGGLSYHRSKNIHLWATFLLVIYT